jgi:hypothetical protein
LITLTLLSLFLPTQVFQASDQNYKEETSIGLYHPPDGVTNPKHKLLCFLTTKFFPRRRRYRLLIGIAAAI